MFWKEKPSLRIEEPMITLIILPCALSGLLKRCITFLICPDDMVLSVSTTYLGDSECSPMVDDPFVKPKSSNISPNSIKPEPSTKRLKTKTHLPRLFVR